MTRLVFLVPVWGRSYVQVMIEGLLPSLLTPRNFPLLCQHRRSALKIISNSEGEMLARDIEVIDKCREFLDVDFVVDDNTIDSNKYASMSRMYLHGLSTLNKENRLSKEDNFIVYLTPDMFCSDGTIETLLECSKSSFKKVMVLGIRVIKDKFLSGIKNYSPGDSSNSLDFLIQLMLSTLHPISEALNVNARTFNNQWPSHLYWIEKNILIAHGFHWHPLMQSHSETWIKTLLEQYSTSTPPTIDDHRFMRESDGKFSHFEHCYVNTDPKRIMLVELSDLPKQRQNNRKTLVSIPSILLWCHFNVDEFQWYLFTHEVIFSLSSSILNEKVINESHVFTEKILAFNKKMPRFLIKLITKFRHLIGFVKLETKRLLRKITQFVT